MNQLSCQKCGKKVVKSGKIIKLKSELGFTIPTEIYECQKCHAKHILCPECGGNCYVKIYDIQDCRECQGMGVIELIGEHEKCNS